MGACGQGDGVAGEHGSAAARSKSGECGFIEGDAQRLPIECGQVGVAVRRNVACAVLALETRCGELPDGDGERGDLGETAIDGGARLDAGDRDECLPWREGSVLRDDTRPIGVRGGYIGQGVHVAGLDVQLCDARVQLVGGLLNDELADPGIADNDADLAANCTVEG